MSPERTVVEIDGRRLWVVSDVRPDEAERVVRATLLRRRGLTLCLIARQVGLSHEWVRQHVLAQENGADRADRLSAKEGD